MHHAKVHLGPFVSIGESVIIPCSLCQFNAKGWSSFFIHIRTHSANKYPCSECQWTFSSPHGLNRHSVGTHDTRHFGCGFCILDFPNNDELCVHAPTHQITCYLCWELFMSEEAFNKHMVRKHPARQLTVQQTRSKEEERAWEQQQIKAMRRLKRELQRDREEDRKGRLHGETSEEHQGQPPVRAPAVPERNEDEVRSPTRPTCLVMTMTTTVMNLPMTTNSTRTSSPKKRRRMTMMMMTMVETETRMYLLTMFFFFLFTCLFAYRKSN